MFVSIHNHSDYSRFDSINKIEKMLVRAKELGQNAVGLCDHGTTSGLLDFYLQAKKAGIKPILGCEFYISTNINVKERGDIYHLCLYAKNFEGYKNINRLNSFAHSHIYYEPRISFEMLRKYSDGLISTSACMGGILKRDDAEEWVRVLKEIFGNDFYLEMQFNSLPEQREYNQKVMAISEKFDIPYICAIDSHYTNKEDAPVHRAWKFIKESSEYYSTDDYYMFSEKEMAERMAAHGWPENVINTAFVNTREIANKCDCYIPTEKLNYPVFPVENQKERVWELVREGARSKLALPLSEEYAKRIKLELDMLEKASYLNYFLILHDLVKWCDNVSKIRRGAGRGSVVASLTAYLLDITGLDPLKYGLLFERFLHLERVTPCDIDTDFESARRGEVIEYLKDKYGYAYQVRTINLVGAKAGIQRAGQSMGLDAIEIDRISASIPKDGNLDNLPKKYDGKILTPKQYAKLLHLAYSFQGLIQSFGVHASAVMLFPKEVENWCSIECQDNNYIVNYDFHLLEEHSGLLKLDILGLKTMDVIQETLSQLSNEQLFFDINNLPDADEKTAQMLSGGNTKGCFQIEGEGMTQLVVDLQPKEFKDLIPLVALYRPGCIKAGMVGDFVKRRRGEEAIEYILPELKPVMQNTYGIMLYQEQVMQMVQVMANYTLGQSDMFRRAIAKQREWKGIPSTTQLLRGTRESYLSLTTEYSVDPQDMVYALFGTRVHDLLDQHTPEDGLSEIRLYDDISSGAYDFYQDGVLYDDKTYGSFAVTKTLGLYSVEIPDGFYKTTAKDGRYKKGDPKYKKEWREGGKKHRFDLAVQMNDYRMKLEKHGLPVKMMVCEMLVRDGGTYIAQSRGVTQRACLAVINKISDKWIHLYMKSKWEQLKHALETNTLPPVCKPRERWYDAKTGKSGKCAKYCHVRGKCNFGLREMAVGGNNVEV